MLTGRMGSSLKNKPQARSLRDMPITVKQAPTVFRAVAEYGETAHTVPAS